jgi:hypothetical protein
VRLITTTLGLLCSAAIGAGASAPAQQAGHAAPGSAPNAPLAQFWIDPGPAPRNLLDGPDAIPAKERPVTDGRVEVLSKDTAGFSTTYKVKDAAGRHQDLLEQIRLEDVRWICERLQKLTDRQLHDAFKAGNFSEEVAARYVARIRQKIKEGLAIR